VLNTAQINAKLNISRSYCVCLSSTSVSKLDLLLLPVETSTKNRNMTRESSQVVESKSEEPRKKPVLLKVKYAGK
jgi:hypothetical protein